nr:immunoglobulin heavy chain junction region [Macaca mulatta]MPN69990.1 immunoglobulin heavy chain junction region [Macaca mulatta]MPN71142.1 immunoglobulin heavy chain junction region [Macaca mulatta]MPN71774.1 immunoglobulin heavy chain junction region [Macaca mulatta]MPN72016.1 immunoglobulin heavy chain junction region [Macaca mulatta]
SAREEGTGYSYGLDSW